MQIQRANAVHQLILLISTKTIRDVLVNPIHDLQEIQIDHLISNQKNGKFGN